MIEIHEEQSNINLRPDRGRDHGFDFIRVISMVGIFAYHALFALGRDDSFSGILSSGEMGYLFVSCFFMLSGGVLVVCYPALRGPGEWQRFYRKRAEAIFPLFYAIYLPLFLWNIWKDPVSSAARFRTHGWTLLFTLIGEDGYLSSTFPTWYLIGEWFLGALILLYVLYPLLNRICEKSIILFGTLCVLSYFLCYPYRLLSPDPITNLFSCLICFGFGMIFARMTVWKSAACAFICGAALVFLLIPGVSETLDPNLHVHLCGICLFVLMHFAGTKCMGFSRVHRVVSWFAGVSYAFFLTHHVILEKCVSLQSKNSTEHPVLFSVGCFLLCCVVSWLISSLFHKMKACLYRMRSAR